MTQFNADVFHAIASATDATTCANLLCANNCLSSLKPFFKDLHIQKTKQLFSDIIGIMEKDHQRLCNKEEQFQCALKMLQQMFKCKYNAELQYQLHKYFKETMQEAYSYTNVQRSLQKYVSETHNYDATDEEVFQILISYIFGSAFTFDFNLITYDEKYQIVISFNFNDSTVELMIYEYIESDNLFEEEFSLSDLNNMIEKLTNVCGEYAIAKRPKETSVEVNCVSSQCLLWPCLYNMWASGQDAVLEETADLSSIRSTFESKSVDMIMALF